MWETREAAYIVSMCAMESSRRDSRSLRKANSIERSAIYLHFATGGRHQVRMLLPRICSSQHLGTSQCASMMITTLTTEREL